MNVAHTPWRSLAAFSYTAMYACVHAIADSLWYRQWRKKCIIKFNVTSGCCREAEEEAVAADR